MTSMIAPRPTTPSHALTPIPTSQDAFDATRPEVRRLLLAIPSFLDLSDEERKKIAADTVRVLSYMADPNGIQAEVAAKEGTAVPAPAHALSATPQARALDDDPVTATQRKLSESPGFAGEDFVAGATKSGVEEFGNLVKKVDFPKFVGGLIKNVFQAIVESSMEQMRAYGELIANVAKTTDQFMRDNIGEGAGRDFLADTYPDVLSVGDGAMAGGFSGDEPPSSDAAKQTVQARGDDAAVRLAEISRDLNLNPPVTDISDANAELKLVTAARLHMAKSRQQLLSSMVMLGINRIVITDGSINAKVLFDMRASDKAQRSYNASMQDTSSQSYKQNIQAEYGSWYTPYSASAAFEGQQDHVATVGSALDETSESKAEVKAKLSGEVRVNFKSDYLPLDKMATPEMMSVIQGNSTPYNPNQKAAAPAGGGAAAG